MKSKRVLSIALSVLMILSLVPPGLISLPAEAAENTSSGAKTAIDEAGYEALGFANLGLEVPEGDIFGPGGNTVMFEQKELLFNYNGSSNYGKMLRDNVNLYQNINPDDLEAAGAMSLYGQYRNDDWSHLNSGNGYNSGRLGGNNTAIVKNTGNTHQNIAYSTSVEFNNGSGKKDHVARVKINSNEKRSAQKVVLEIYTYEDGAEIRKGGWNLFYVNDTAKSLARAGVWRNHEFDSLVEITAGDYDGDGKDEIAVYGANNEIEIYKYTGSKLRTWKTISASALSANSGLYKSADDGLGNVEMAAVVTMASGDLNKDYTDELAIAVSMPRETDISKFRSNNNLFIYSLNREDGTSSGNFKQVGKISLSDGENSMDSANVAIGDMTGNGHKELVVAGWKASANTDRSSTIMALHVEYKRSNKSYTANSFQTIELEDTAPDKKGSTALYNAPPGVAVVNMGGLTGETSRIYVFINNFLYNYDAGTKRYEKVPGGDIEFLTKQKNNADENTDKDETWISKIVTGNFSGSDDGKEALVAVIGQRESGGDSTEHWYYYSIAYLTPNGTDGFYKGCEGVINQGRSYINRTDKSRASVFLDLCSPNTDDDSLLLKYKGAEAYYSKPEVQAILQSAPYFQDVADSFDNYLDDGATGYGTSAGSSSGATASVSAALGAYTDNEVQLGGAGQFELEVRATVSYDHESSLEVTTSREFMGNAGDDYVVMYTIPYYRYWYDAYEPSTGETYEMKIEEPLTPATVIVPVETYDEIAGQYSGLEKIRGNVLKNTPGDPYSYEEWACGNFEAIGDVQMLTNAGAQSGSLVTVSQESVDSETNSFSVGVEENLKVGAGGGLFGNKSVTGVSQSLSVAGGGVFSNMSGVAYTGSVDNLPAGVSGYGFNWQFGISEIEFNGETVIVVGYQTSNVKSGPKAPKNLNITDISSTAMGLEWEGTDDASVYEVSILTNNMELPVATIPATDVDDDGMVRYTADELSPNRQYTFRVTASNALGIRSVSGQDAVGTTLPENSGNFMITAQPSDTSAAPGHTAAFEVVASSTNKGAIGYRWQYYDETVRTWMQVGTNSAKLNVTANAEIDGRRYRCVVYQGDYFLRTKTVTLSVDKSPTNTELTLKNNTDVLAEGSFVKANDTVMVPNGEIESLKYSTETKTINGVTYTRYGTVSANEETETYTASDYWLKNGTDGEFYKISGDTATAVPAKLLYKHSYNSTYVDVDVEPVTVDVITIKEAAGEGEGATPAVTSASAYQTADGRRIYIASDGKNYIYENGAYSEFGTVAKGEDSEATLYLNDGTRYVAVNELVVYYNSTTVSEPQYTQKAADGDVINLISSVSGNDGTVSDQKVVFSITNKETGTVSSVTGTLKNGQYTAEYTFDNAGVYGIVAIYPGSDTYITSRSDETIIYATGSNDELVLSGGTITYGDSLTLIPALLKSDGTVDSNITVNYTTIVRDGKAVSTNLISGNIFRPDRAGTYEISATYNTMNVTAVVNVDYRELVLRPDDVETGVNDTDKESKMTMTVENNILGDGDYILYSRATRSNQVGEYPISVTLTQQGNSKISGKYIVYSDNGTYTLTTKSYEITANAGANGTVQITYSVGGGNPITISNGMRVPEGSTVVLIAQPDSGYGVSGWNIEKGDPTSEEQKAGSKTFENITDDVVASVSFGQVFSSLIYGSNNDSWGTVTGKYTDSNVSFVSGDKINVMQSVTLSASPADGYVVAKWTKNDHASGKTEVMTNSDGTNYTGLTVNVTGVNSQVEYVAEFEAKKAIAMNFEVYDLNYSSVVGAANVYVNGALLPKDSNGNFVYSGYEHENIKIKVSIPANMLVDNWELNGSPAYDSVTDIELNDISGDYNFTINCITPNGRKVTLETALENTNGGTTYGSSLTATRTGATSVESGSEQPQGSEIIFTATPADGYRVNRIVVVNEDGSETLLTGEEITSGKVTLDVAMTIKAYFEKKPVVTYENIAENGDITAQASGVNKASGDYVEFGSTVQLNITPDAGYIVDKVEMTSGGTTTEAELEMAGGESDAATVTVKDIQLDADFVVTYRKKPVITINSADHGTVKIEAVKDFSETAIESDSYVDFGTDLTVTATPNAGYYVYSVTIGGEEKFRDSQEVYTGGEETITYDLEGGVQADTKIIVVLKAKPVITVNKTNAAVTVKCGSEEVTTAWIEKYTDDLSLTVVPDDGYEMKSAVTANNITIKAENADENDTKIISVSDVITQDVVVTVVAEPIPTISFKATVEKIDEEGDGYHGTVSANVIRKKLDFYTAAVEADTETDVYRDSVISVEASPEEGYRVQSWTVNGNVQSEASNTLVLNATDTNYEVSVRFIKSVAGISFGPTDAGDEQGYISEAIAGGVSQLNNASGGINLSEGASISFTATPAIGYEVDYWMINSAKVDGTDGLTEYTYTSLGTSESVYIEPHFVQIEYTVTASVSNGAIAITPSLDENKARGGETLTFTVIPDSGYAVQKWRVNGEEIEGESGSTLIWTVPNGASADPAVSEYEIQAVMDRGSYKIAYSTAENGTVSGSVENGEYVDSGTEVTVSAVPDTGYHLDYWKVNGKKQISTENSITVLVDVDTTVEAVFAIDLVVVTFKTEGNEGKLTATYNGKKFTSGNAVKYGSEVAFTAVPTGDDMVGVWKVNDVEVDGTAMTGETDAPTTYTLSSITEETEVSVEFITRPVYKVSAQATGNGIVEISGDTDALGYIEVKRGENVKVTATADEYYQLKGWSVNGSQAGSENVLVVAGVRKDTEVNAEFMEAVGYNVTLTVNNTSGATPEIKVDTNGTQIHPGSTAEDAVSVIGGKNVTVTVTPTESNGRSTMMIKRWYINGIPVTDENAAELGIVFADGDVSRGFTIPKISENSDITVDIVPYVGFAIPADGDGYTVETIERTPAYSKPETEIIAGGDVVFKVVPDEFMGITKLSVNGIDCLTLPAEGSVTAIANGDGSYTVTVVNLEALEAEIEAQYNTHTITISSTTNGSLVVDNNGVSVISGMAVQEGTELTITAVPAEGYKVSTLKINDKSFTSGSTHTLVEDITITATFTKSSTGSSGGGGGGGTSSYTVKFETNGGTEIKDVKVAKNNTVEKPKDPERAGYAFDGWYCDEKLETIYDFETKVTRAITLYAKWNPQTVDPGGSSEWINPFIDVDADDWYYDDVKYTNKNGLMMGTSNTLFSPDATLTRAMLVTVLYRAEGELEITGTTTFEDVDDNAYYAKAVVWGQQNGIIKGYSETEFAPDANITREQIAAIMHRYAQHKGYDVSAGENTNILSYDDFDSISEYAIASMQYAVGSGLMRGKTTSTLNPLDNATRAEIAAILHRFIEANK